MNLLALVLGLLPWAETPVAAFTGLYLACGLLSVEAQLVTVTGRGSIDALLPLNATIAAVTIGWHLRARTPLWRWVAPTRARIHVPAVLILLLVVLALNLWRPTQAADPYQLDRVLQIERTGTLAYSLAIDAKANIVGAFYELALADVQSVPVVGSWLLRLHGVGGVLLFALAVATARTWLPVTESRWASAAMFVVPVVFHQFVYIKNDLFAGAPALVALAWAVGSHGDPTARASIWAGWLAGLVMAGKLTNAAVALVVGAATLVRTRRWTSLVPVGTGIVGGLLTGGVALTLWQNTTVYGDPFAAAQVEAIGSVNRSLGSAAVGLVRFLMSLVDMSLLTRVIWPGRGGWGGAFGLPLLWALVVLAVECRKRIDARAALAAGGLGLLALGVTFPDADISHRLALGPGLLLVAAGVSTASVTRRPWALRSLMVVVVLSALQIGRSAILYALR